jgi:hypothetical protein
MTYLVGPIAGKRAPGTLAKHLASKERCKGPIVVVVIAAPNLDATYTVGFGLTIEAPLRNGRADAPIGVRVMVGCKVNAATYVSS